MKNQEKELASINVRIENLITAATPIREEIITNHGSVTPETH
jgi:hypothetical protein